MTCPVNASPTLGGSWKALQYENGARVRTPAADTELTRAIGRGTTELISSG